MNYLEDIHYDTCQYFDKEVIAEENYNAFDDFLLNDGNIFNQEPVDQICCMMKYITWYDMF